MTNGKYFCTEDFSCIIAALHQVDTNGTNEGQLFKKLTYFKQPLRPSIRELHERPEKHLTYNCIDIFLPETITDDPGSIIPLFGLTQYRRGAVVFTLKHTFLSDGFRSLRFVVTTSVKGPEKKVDFFLNMHVSLEKKSVIRYKLLLKYILMATNF